MAGKLTIEIYKEKNASDLTAAIAADMGNSANGGEQNLALWSMALLLFIISMFFIFLIHFISAKGELKKS